MLRRTNLSFSLSLLFVLFECALRTVAFRVPRSLEPFPMSISSSRAGASTSAPKEDPFNAPFDILKSQQKMPAKIDSWEALWQRKKLLSKNDTNIQKDRSVSSSKKENLLWVFARNSVFYSKKDQTKIQDDTKIHVIRNPWSWLAAWLAATIAALEISRTVAPGEESSLSPKSMSATTTGSDASTSTPEKSIQEHTMSEQPALLLATQGEWGAYLDDATGLVYYFHAQTGASRWTPPAKGFPRVAIPQDVVPKPFATVGQWSSYWDQTGTGRLYYFNQETGESLWEPPFESFPRIDGQRITPTPLAASGDWQKPPDFGNGHIGPKEVFAMWLDRFWRAHIEVLATFIKPLQHQQEPTESVKAAKKTAPLWGDDSGTTSEPKANNIVKYVMDAVKSNQPADEPFDPLAFVTDFILQDKKTDESFVRPAPTFRIPNNLYDSRRRNAGHADVPDNIPRLARWKQNQDGSVTGRIFNSDNFASGTLVTTAPMSSQRRDAQPQSTVKTVSGSQYYLV